VKHGVLTEIALTDRCFKEAKIARQQDQDGRIFGLSGVVLQGKHPAGVR